MPWWESNFGQQVACRSLYSLSYLDSINNCYFSIDYCTHIQKLVINKKYYRSLSKTTTDNLQKKFPYIQRRKYIIRVSRECRISELLSQILWELRKRFSCTHLCISDTVFIYSLDQVTSSRLTSFPKILNSCIDCLITKSALSIVALKATFITVDA